jgi:Cof subfamily protein (haloacid dehalogenase superfamily)
MILPRLQNLRDRYDAVLLDLDGTLLDRDARLTPRTARAVRALHDAGLFVLLCTGRSVAGTREHAEALGLGTPVVTYNGSWIGIPGDEPMHYIPIPDAHIDVLLRAERMASFAFRHRAEEKYTVMTEHPEHQVIAEWFANVKRMPSRDLMPARDLMRLSLFFDGRECTEDDVRSVMWEPLPADVREALRLEAFPLNVFPNYEDSTTLLFEVQGGSRGKAEALDWLEQAHDIPADRVVAVGDHRNDLSMLAEAGLAVAMGNGVPEVHALADVVIGHHADEGVAAWIEEGAPPEWNGAESS